MASLWFITPRKNLFSVEVDPQRLLVGQTDLQGAGYQPGPGVVGVR